MSKKVLIDKEGLIMYHDGIMKEYIKPLQDIVGTSNDGYDVREEVSKVNGRLNAVDSQLADIKNKEYYVIDYGLLPNDSNIDNSIKLQELLNEIADENLNGGKIVFPIGKFYFKTSLIIPENISIEGYNAPCRNTTNKYTEFIFEPSTKSTFISLKRNKWYSYGFNLKNISIKTNDNGDIGLDMCHSSYNIIENVDIYGFNINIVIDNGMFGDYKNVTSTGFRKYGLYITDNIGINTTQRFYNCYFGQTYVRAGFGRDEYLTAKPIKIKSNSITDCFFNSCTIESTEQGIEIGFGCVVTFNNIYVECVPTTNPDFVFNIGTQSDVTYKEGDFKGILNIFGGRIISTSFIPYDTEGTGIFNIDVLDLLNVNGVLLMNARDVITTSINTKKCIFNSCVEKTVLNGLYNNRNKKVNINNSIGLNSSVITKQDSITFYSSDNKNSGYVLKSDYKNTDGDIYLAKIDEGKIIIGCDNNKNICNNYDGSNGGAISSNIYGLGCKPSNVTLINGVVEWVEVDNNNIPKKYVIHKDGKMYQAIESRGTTSERPIKNRYDGMMFYDTTLHKHITYNAYQGRWEDLLGNLV